MYRIIHPMNNNVALVQNELQQELIVVGSGIAFGKKKHDLVADDKVETRTLYKEIDNGGYDKTEKCHKEKLAH